MTIRLRVQELEKQLEELKKEIQKQNKKEHKSLSDYRYYEKKFKLGEQCKIITSCDEIEISKMWDGDFDNIQFRKGNIYSIGTPDELLEREIKKRQLWFALEKHLKENNCLATNEDWKDVEKPKDYVYYDYQSDHIKYETKWWCKENTIYSTDEEVLTNYMKTLTEEDIKIMFDVE